jgi:hypothetical protein
MSEIIEWAAKYAVVQSALAAVVLLYGWHWIIRRGEKEPSTEQEMRARWQQQQDFHDISENVKTIVTLQRDIKETINRWIAIQFNDRQP